MGWAHAANRIITKESAARGKGQKSENAQKSPEPSFQTENNRRKVTENS